VIKYLNAATKIMLMIEPDDYTRWWVCSSYAVYPDKNSLSSIL